MNNPAPPARFPIIRRPRRRGFTIAELTVSLVVSSMLVVAIGSSIVIASHAIPDGTETTMATVLAGRRLDRLTEELRYATAIEEYTATAVEFFVGDRDGDFIEEVIRYEWAGAAGDPLTRRYNGGPAVIIIPGVQSFDLSYVTTMYDRQLPPATSPEIVLAEHYDALADGVLKITKDNWIGQFFQPEVLPLETDTWSVTRVQYQAQSQGAVTGEISVQLRAPDGSLLPSAAALESSSKLEIDLQTTMFWEEAVFSTALGFAPGDGLCLVLEWVSGGGAAEINYSTKSGTGLLLTTDGGVSWTKSDTGAMNYTVHGTYTTLGSIVKMHALERVDIQLIAGSDRDFVLYASAHTVNQPEVSMP